MKREWHKGPPPHVGWWNASVGEDKEVWRWWNGRVWSRAVPSGARGMVAEIQAKRPAFISELVMWTTYWPANARVPRVKP